MTRLWQRLVDAWFAPAPARRLAAVRLGVGAFTLFYLWNRLPLLLGASTYPRDHFHPTGVVRLLLDAPLGNGVLQAQVFATLALAVAFVLGVGHRWVAPVFAVLLLWTITYSNSWGMVFHTENMMVLHVLVLALAPAAEAWSVDAWWRRRRGASISPGNHARFGWPLRLMAAVTCATYLLAGIAKLRIAGFDWIASAELRNQIAFDNLRKAVLGSGVADLATPLLGHTKLFVGLAAMSIALELGAPIALLDRRIALIWSLGAWSFHVGVVLLMNIYFPYQLAFIAYLPLLRCERPIDWVLQKVRAGSARRG